MELHVHLSNLTLPKYFTSTYHELNLAILNEEKVIHTTQTSAINTDNIEKGYKLFVHFIDGEVKEMKLGYIDGCNKEIRKEHNLEKMVRANVFGLANLNSMTDKDILTNSKLIEVLINQLKEIWYLRMEATNYITLVNKLNGEYVNLYAYNDEWCQENMVKVANALDKHPNYNEQYNL